MELDLIQKRCLSDDVRFADLMNGLLFDGFVQIRPEDLQEMKSEVACKVGDRRTSRSRDIVKKTAFGVNFLVLGIENQDKVHYLMPLRAMSYDAGEYERQAATIRKWVKKQKGSTDSEFLSGFTKKDRLKPCITLVLYYGEDWDGSRDLHGILDMTDIPQRLRKYINNYPIHLFEVRKLERTEVFRSDLKQIFDFIRYSKDKEKLKELIQNDPAYSSMDEDAYDMALACAHATELEKAIKPLGRSGGVDMCQALTEMLQDERTEGRLEILISLVKEGVLSLGDAASRMGLSEEDFLHRMEVA